MRLLIRSEASGAPSAKSHATSQFAKILQSELVLGYLVEVTSTMKYLYVSGPVAASLQAVDRCTGENFFARLRDS